jgi:uncharacterized membrane protein YkoI
MKRSHPQTYLAILLATSLPLVAPLASADEPSDIGFARAEQIALERVPGVVKEMERDQKLGKSVFEVEVRTSEGADFDVTIDAATGSILKIEQDD